MTVLVDDDWLIPVVQAAIVLLVAIAIIVANVLVIATFIMQPGERDVMVYYLLSLAAADLLCGLLVVPLSVYPAVEGEWIYGDLVCRVEGYLSVSLWSVSVYTFMWISVDRYLAVRKPLRYETIQTRTRCQCWMLFTWIMGTMLCCPPLLGYTKATFVRDASICMLDWASMVAYSLTLTALVLGPSLCTIVYTYAFIFNTMRKVRKTVAAPPDKEYVSALADVVANPHHLMAFVLILVFWISWLPWIGLIAYEHFAGRVDVPLLRFCVVWIGVLNSFWKALVYIVMIPQFRCGVRLVCMTLCCRIKPTPIPFSRPPPQQARQDLLPN